MKAKKIIACIISCILFMVCVPFTATAKVLEPEVVKTEKWTTSYYIDDDIDTLYPYIQCEADIYNDGTIKLYMWNTHEWDGFATVKHTATVIQTTPVGQGDTLYRYSKGEFPNSDLPGVFDVSYYSSKYYFLESGYGDGFYRTVSCASIGGARVDIYNATYTGALPEMPVSTQRALYPQCTFWPNEDPTGIYKFRLFGHDITITPELLSGNIVATPSDDGYKTITYNNGSSTSKIKTDTDVSDIQKYIDKLEAENALLRQENTEQRNKINLLSTGTYGDVNGDQVVDVQDAQIILAYYTERDVAKKSVPDLVTFGLNFGKE